MREDKFVNEYQTKDTKNILESFLKYLKINKFLEIMEGQKIRIASWIAQKEHLERKHIFEKGIWKS